MIAIPGTVAGAVALRHERAKWRPTWLLLGASASPAIWFAVEQALRQRNTFPPSADPHHNAHWWAMSVLAFAIVTLAFAWAFTRARGTVSLAGMSALVVAGVALIRGDAASAPARPWAVGAVAWGVTALAVAARTRGAPLPGTGTATSRDVRRPQGHE